MSSCGKEETSAAHRLPVELVSRICILAAENDRHCAYALAFTSRDVCKWTAEARWKTIAITNVKQYFAFVRELLELPDDLFDKVLLFMSHHYPTLLSMVSKPDESSPRQSISHPKVKLIRHMFIDIDEAEEGISGGYHRLEGLLRDTQLNELKGEAMSSEGHVFKYPFVNAIIMPLSHYGRITDKQGFGFEHVSLGPNSGRLASQVGDDYLALREFTGVLGPKDNFAWFMGKPIAFQWLERLHLIGVDDHSSLSGVDPPWILLDAMRRNRGTKKSLSHIRYDTRKFAFKPAEIFATRLRPLLQEMTVDYSSTEVSPQSVVNNTTSIYQHEGPRHSAPSRGAYHQYKQNNSSTRALTPVQHIKGDVFADILETEFKEGSLEFLQFAWEPMNALEKRAEDVPWHRRARFSSGNIDEDDGKKGQKENVDTLKDTGGWPRERKGAWTERSDRDLSPTFAAELRDAINSLYGWDAPGIEAAAKFSARKESLPKEEGEKLKNVAFTSVGSGEMVEKIRKGVKEEDRERLERRANDIQSVLNSQEDQLTSTSTPKLQYGVRAPRSLVHLGGKVPYSKAERLALFEDRARGGKGAWP
jgi:hypothetical protein